jgi:hypothetical protein
MSSKQKVVCPKMSFEQKVLCPKMSFEQNFFDSGSIERGLRAKPRQVAAKPNDVQFFS